MWLHTMPYIQGLFRRYNICGHWSITLFDPAFSTTSQRFDEQDHNLLGALQIVAKLLEIWFTLIVAALVSKMTLRLAGRNEGLPIELLTRPSGFADLPGTLGEPLLRKARASILAPKRVLLDAFHRIWTAILSIFSSNQRGSGNTHRWRIRIFVAITAVLCIVCNLMGPAVAVLVLPTLRWIPTTSVGDRTFDSIGAGEPPQTGLSGGRDRYFSMYTPDCSADDFNNLSFSCATDPYASKLDSWIGTYIAAGDYVDGLTQEWSVKFRVNQTSSASELESVDYLQNSPFTWWIPCRQILSSLDDDLNTVQMISLGYNKTFIDHEFGTDIERRLVDSPETYESYNNSLRLVLQRKGPVLGAIVQMHYDSDNTSTWTSKIDDQRSVRCYRNYDLTVAPFYEQRETTSFESFTKCVRVGRGWSESNRATNFTIAGERNDTTNVASPGVEFSIFSSDKAQFFMDNKFPSWLPSECLQPRDVPLTTVFCDWERLFHTEPDAYLYNRTQDVTTIEMSIKQTSINNTNNTNNSLTRLTVDFVAFLNFTTYELDPSLITNPVALATTQTLPSSGMSIHIDPAWILAAWTADHNGTLKPNRTATKEVLQTMKRFSSFDPNDELWDTVDLLHHLSYISLLPVAQALSMIDYNTTAHSSTKAAIAEGERDRTRPQLTRSASMYVWAYGVNSRTSKWGVAVAFIGIAIVLAQTVVGFVDRRKAPSLDQLLVAALEYLPRDDFEQGVGRRGDEAAKRHFLLREKEACKGRYQFERPCAVRV